MNFKPASPASPAIISDPAQVQAHVQRAVETLPSEPFSTKYVDVSVFGRHVDHSEVTPELRSLLSEVISGLEAAGYAVTEKRSGMRISVRRKLS